VIGSFDRLGFERHRKRFRAADLDVRLEGRVCLVTGANSGIGRATSRALAARGAHVILLCRDPGRGEEARDAVRRETGNPRVDLGLLDVSDLGAVRRVAAELRVEAVHALVHNAGVLTDRRILTRDGLELTFATHVAGPHLLTALLAGRLRAGQGRVVWVASGGMYLQRLSLDDLTWERRRHDGVVAYAQAKRMQVVLARQWARRFAGSGVEVHAMHPGWADTAAVRTSLPRFHRVMEPLLRDAEAGADTVIWLVVNPSLPGPSGSFWFDRARRWAHVLPWTAEWPGEAERLARLCDEATGAPAIQADGPVRARPVELASQAGAPGRAPRNRHRGAAGGVG
jgi:NAD(P)-dependent dehydrogenase (short-subunit alcohol dehydrogenase family)